MSGLRHEAPEPVAQKITRPAWPHLHPEAEPELTPGEELMRDHGIEVVPVRRRFSRSAKA